VVLLLQLLVLLVVERNKHRTQRRSKEREQQQSRAGCRCRRAERENVTVHARTTARRRLASGRMITRRARPRGQARSRRRWARGAHVAASLRG